MTAASREGVLDDAVLRLIGAAQYVTEAGVPANRQNVRAMCAASENANPVHWDHGAALAILGAPYCPATLLAAWGRPELWEPDQEQPLRALQAHFDLKDMLGYPASIAVSNTVIFYRPVEIGDRLKTQQVVRAIGDIKQTKLGRGRFWTIEMQYLGESERLVGVERYDFLGFVKDGA